MQLLYNYTSNTQEVKSGDDEETYQNLQTYNKLQKRAARTAIFFNIDLSRPLSGRNKSPKNWLKSPTDLSRPFWRVPSQKHWLKSPTLGVRRRSPRKFLGFSKGNFPDFPLKIRFLRKKITTKIADFLLEGTKFPGGCAPDPILIQVYIDVFCS